MREVIGVIIMIALGIAAAYLFRNHIPSGASCPNPIKVGQSLVCR